MRCFVLLLLLGCAALAATRSVHSVESKPDVTFGITDEIRDRLEATRLYKLLLRIANEIRNKAGVARDLAIRRAIELIESDLVQDALAKIPASWRENFVKLLEKLKERAEEAANRLQKLVDFVKDRTNAIIEGLKDRVDTDAAGILKKLHDALVLLKDKSAEAKEAGRKQLLELLASDALEKALSKLPEKVQAELRRQVESLKDALENGLEEEAAVYSSELGALEAASAIDIFAIIRDLTDLLELVKNVGAHAGMDLVMRYHEIVDSKEFKDLMNRLPESWRERINIIVQKVKDAVKALEEKIEAAKAAVRAKIQEVISILKEKAVYVMEKLKEIMDMLNIRGTAILNTIKSKVSELINSPYFDVAVAMLPEAMREPVNKVVAQLKEWLGVQTAITFGIRDEFEKIKEILGNTRTVQELIQLYEDIKTNVGVARDLAIQKIIELYESDFVQSILSKIPESWRNQFVVIVKEILAQGPVIAERLRQLWEFTKVRTGRIIDAIKEDADAAGITAKLQEARDLIEQKTTEAKELGREKLLDLLNSEAFETVLSKLPEETQKTVRKQAESLKNALEKGVVEPSPAEFAVTFGIREEYEKMKKILAATKTVQELIRLYEDIKTNAGVARDLTIQKIIEFYESDFVQGILSWIPESWRNQFVELVKELIAQGPEIAKRLRQLWEFTKVRTGRIIDAIKEDADAAGITAKLQEARDLIEQKTTEAKEAGRAQLLDLLGSDEFEAVLSRLPEETQAKIRAEAEALKNALEKGVTEEEAAPVAFMSAEPAVAYKLSYLEMIDKMVKAIDSLRNENNPVRLIVIKAWKELLDSQMYKDIVAKVPPSLKQKIQALETELRSLIHSLEGKVRAFWAEAEGKAKALAKELEKYADKSPEVRKLLTEVKKLWSNSAEERETARVVVIKILDSPVFDLALKFMPPHVRVPVRILGIALLEILEHHPVAKN